MNAGYLRAALAGVPDDIAVRFHDADDYPHEVADAYWVSDEHEPVFYLVAPEREEDLSDCPYYKQDGSEGSYGPNTCASGCWTEPACKTGEPTEGWPSVRLGGAS